MMNFKTRISLIFGADSTLGDYPLHLPPDNPADGATAIEKKIWKLDRIEYNKQTTKLEDKSNLYGAMVGQISENSKIRAKEVQTGVEAEAEFEPSKLLQAILATHIGDSTLGVAHQMCNITERHNMLVMGSHDSLSTYLTNTKSALYNKLLRWWVELG